jgi:flagellar FliJ protein
MTRSERLRPVQRITESREKDAARVLGECQQQLQQMQQQLSELERYREEYRGHYQQHGSAGFSAQKLQQLQYFLANLDQAITQQQQAIRKAEAHCEEKKRLWFQARGRTQALDKVSEHYQQDERQQQNRREQKENDEFAQRRSPGVPKK